MEEKIKYVLNGTTKYYTKEELKTYYKNLLVNNKVYFEEDFEMDFRKLLQDLDEHSGDPYGDIQDKKTWKMLHEFEGKGGLIIFK